MLVAPPITAHVGVSQEIIEFMRESAQSKINDLTVALRYDTLDDGVMLTYSPAPYYDDPECTYASYRSQCRIQARHEFSRAAKGGEEVITSKDFQEMGIDRSRLMTLEAAENAILDIGRRAVAKSNKPMSASTLAVGLEQFRKWDINQLCGRAK